MVINLQDKIADRIRSELRAVVAEEIAILDQLATTDDLEGACDQRAVAREAVYSVIGEKLFDQLYGS